MKKVTQKIKRHLSTRARYQAKRRTKKWKNRRRNKRIIFKEQTVKKRAQKRKPPIPLPAPKIFSIIENTEEVLKYFDKAERMTRQKNNIVLDISEVDILTPATVALMIASINDADFIHDANIIGNAPKKPELKKLFTESGFYSYVKARRSFSSSKESLLHKEVDHKVAPDVAKKASLIGLRHVFSSENTFEPLYEVLVECMSNTNNHADLKVKGKCNWWLYVYNNPESKVTSYTFLDLGVGIFGSVVVQNYLRRLAGNLLYPNLKIVDDLLSGKIQSRVDKDQAIRGKGIPQIVEHSGSEHFKQFYIIANDVMINLKSRKSMALRYRLNGTLLYWELQG